MNWESLVKKWKKLVKLFQSKIIYTSNIVITYNGKEIDANSELGKKLIADIESQGNEMWDMAKTMKTSARQVTLDFKERQKSDDRTYH